ALHRRPQPAARLCARHGPAIQWLAMGNLSARRRRGHHHPGTHSRIPRLPQSLVAERSRDPVPGLEDGRSRALKFAIPAYATNNLGDTIQSIALSCLTGKALGIMRHRMAKMNWGFFNRTFVVNGWHCNGNEI